MEVNGLCEVGVANLITFKEWKVSYHSVINFIKCEELVVKNTFSQNNYEIFGKKFYDQKWWYDHYWK